MITLYHDAKAMQRRQDPQEFAKLGAEYEAFTQSVRATGNLVAGDPVQAGATTVRGNGSNITSSDGPAYESPLSMVGYYILEFPSLAAAVEAAGRIPAARLGAVEVREFMQL
jgi:hypothetical protein